MSEIKMQQEAGINYEAEYERLSMIIMRQNEMIEALTKASFNLSDALVQMEKGVRP